LPEKILVTSALPYANGPIHLGHLAGAYLPADIFVRYHRLKGSYVIYICGSDEHGVQLYDPEAAVFLADRFIRGECPVCDYDDAYGDQCEKCGSSLSPKELKNPRSAITNAKPVLKETTHWYLPLSKYQKILEEWIGSHPEWKQNVLGQIQSWFNDGLNDRAVTRDMTWGVPVPEDAAEKYGVDAKGKVLYVWFDAPIGYISATKEWALENKQPDAWKDYWQDKNTRLVHFIGKDNIVFHCIIFPAMLKTHGSYVMPDNVPANEFLNLEGKKLSTSRNYAVWLEEYLKNFDADSLRYVLAGNMPETRDADFSWKEFQARHNNELADILGNFINRTMTFAGKYFSGKVPSRNSLCSLDKELIQKLTEAPAKLGGLIDKYQFKAYVREYMDIARFANKYFNDKEPWKTRKENQEDCAVTINLCLQTVHALSILAAPLLPDSTEKILKILNVPEKCNWDEAGGLLLKDGHKLNKPEIIFRKIEDDAVEAETRKLKSVLESPDQEASEADLIDIEDFAKVHLQVGEILAAEKVKKSDKLLKLEIALGGETRQIVGGIAEFYKPEELIGKKVVVAANLKPAVLRGVKSEGMVLAAADGDKFSLLTVMEDVPSGTTIR